MNRFNPEQFPNWLRVGLIVFSSVWIVTIPFMFWRKHRYTWLPYAGAAAAAVFVLGIAVGGQTEESASSGASTERPSEAQPLTRTSTPSAARKSTPPSTSTPSPTPPPAPSAVEGRGTRVSETFMLPSGIWILDIQHRGGQSNFVVWAHDSRGSSDLLVNEIGPYSGSRWLVGDEEYFLEVDADGSWRVEFRSIGPEQPPFSGSGDYVTGAFEPSGRVVEYSHTGSSNFAVWAHCEGGSDLLANEIGSVSASVVLRGGGVCFLDIQADGRWAVSFR